jgi:hypothetical protein
MTKNIQIGEMFEKLEKYETLIYSDILLSMIGMFIASVLRSAIFM